MPKHISTMAMSVRRAIENRDWTISELARRSGVHRVTLSRFLGGHQTISADKLESIMACMGVLTTVCRTLEGEPGMNAGPADPMPAPRRIGKAGGPGRTGGRASTRG